MTSEHTDSTEVPPQPLRSLPWQVRVILAVLFVLAGATLWLTNTILTDRFLDGVLTALRSWFHGHDASFEIRCKCSVAVGTHGF